MKHLIYVFTVVLLLSACNGGNVKLLSSSKPIDSVSYAIGMFEAYSTLEHIKGSGQSLEGLDYDYLVAGFKSVLLKSDSIDNERRQWSSDVINRYITQKRQEELERIKTEDAVFLKKNAENDSVTVLPSGLQYKIIAEGTGISPKVSDTVNVIYTGTLADGTTFDSSRGDTVKMPLSRMIKGWQEGLPLMKEKAKYKFYIPSDLAYGESGRLAGRVLIFDVELISVNKGPATKEKK
ncbi:MAG: FKBP-type peptidyl-prolyl cis-trans isomerase [Prevotellaceae bacterium]|jgi:FKBP-type peptidyl-prolyl cis-trans isomerase|nr:FKBP-type peptidyl-prolyl cis-trans isomerase [Prevotellaceae bacterium]